MTESRLSRYCFVMLMCQKVLRFDYILIKAYSLLVGRSVPVHVNLKMATNAELGVLILLGSFLAVHCIVVDLDGANFDQVETVKVA